MLQEVVLEIFFFLCFIERENFVAEKEGSQSWIENIVGAGKEEMFLIGDVMSIRPNKIGHNLGMIVFQSNSYSTHLKFVDPSSFIGLDIVEFSYCDLLKNILFFRG